MYPQEFRDQVVQAFENKEGSYEKLAKRFGLATRTIRTWVRRARNPPPEGSIKPIGRQPFFSEDNLELLREIKEANPDVGLSQLAELFAQRTQKPVPKTPVFSKALKTLGYSYRKIKPEGQVQKTEEDKSYRYQQKHRDIPKAPEHRRAYPSDLTDAQWSLLQPLFEKSGNKGRPRKVPLREIVNAMLYIDRTGCQWRYLPHDFPDWQLVAKTFYRWRDKGLWQTVHDTLREQVRVAAGREVSPSVSIIDSQSAKSTESGGVVGFDAGKK